MGTRRTAKRSRLHKIRPRPAPHRGPLLEAPDDPAIAQLTGDILQHLSAANSQSVERRADIGELLIDLRQRLPHGAFQPHVRAHIPFTRMTAQRAMNLHRFRQNQPTLFDKLGPIGVSKANVLISLPVPQIEQLVSQAHDVPSTGATKTLLAMTFKEMMEVVTQATPPPSEHELLLRNYRRAMGRAMHALDALVDVSETIDPKDLRTHYEGLRLTLSRFGATFFAPP